MCTVVGGVRVCVREGGVWVLRPIFSDAPAIPISLKRIFTSRRMGPEPRWPAGGGQVRRARLRAGVTGAAGAGGGLTVSILAQFAGAPFLGLRKRKERKEKTEIDSDFTLQSPPGFELPLKFTGTP